MTTEPPLTAEEIAREQGIGEILWWLHQQAELIRARRRAEAQAQPAAPGDEQRGGRPYEQR